MPDPEHGQPPEHAVAGTAVGRMAAQPLAVLDMVQELLAAKATRRWGRKGVVLSLVSLKEAVEALPVELSRKGVPGRRSGSRLRGVVHVA